MPRSSFWLFDPSGFVPRWSCGDWSAGLGWLHIGADLAIWLAYLAIPVVLVYFVRRRRDVPFSGVFWLFGLFIVSCGTVHLLDAVIFYHPLYRLIGVVKVVTAVASWGTVLALVAVVPRALTLRTPAQFEAEVAARTAELAEANAALRRAAEERVRAEEARRATEERFHRTFDAMLEGCQIIGFDWRYLYVNDSAAGHARCTRGELLGRAMGEVYPGIERTELFTALSRCMADRVPQRMQNRFEYPDGRAAWFDLSIQPDPDGIFVLSADVTARKSAEGALRESEERFRGAFEHTNVAMALTDLEGRFVRANAAFARLFGYEPDELPGRGTDDITHPDHLSTSYALRETLLDGSANHFEVEKRYAHRGGREVWGLTNVSLLRDPNGRPRHYVWQVQDVTARKRAECVLRESEERYRALADGVPQIVWAARADGSIDYLNRRALEYSGRGLDGLDGWSWERVVHPDDLPHAATTWGAVLRTGEPREFEFRLRRADGAYRWYLARQVAMRGPGGAVERWVGTCTDVHDQKAAAERLARDALLLASVRDAVVVTDRAGVVTDWNEGAARLFGWRAGEAVGRSYPDLFPAPDRRAIAARLRSCADGGEWSGELEGARQDGSRVWVDARVYPLAGADGRPAGVVCVSHDITARVRAEAALRETAERYRLLFDSNPHPMWVYDVDGLRFRAVNDAAVRLYGYSREEFLGMTLRDIRPHGEVPALEAVIAAAGPHPTRAAVWRHRRKDGTLFDAEVASHVLPYDGRPCRLALALDVTERRRAEEERDRQRRELQFLFDTVPAAIFYKDATHRLVRVNREMARIMGRPREELEGRDDGQIGSPYAGQYLQDEREVMATGVAKRGLMEPLVTPTGVRWMRTDKLPHRDDTGRIVGVVGLAIDITDRREAEELLGAVMQSVPDAIVTTDEGGAVLSVNSAAGRLFGCAEGDLVGRPADELLIGPDPWSGFRAALGGPHEVLGRRPGGGTFPVDLSVSEFRLAGARRFTAVVRDVTARKRLEDQLRQSQKMEAFGQLAGGVAHDFNNLLTVINGFTELALAEAPAGAPVRETLAAVRDAGERAAALTAQLLAFSRKTVIAPKVLDLNAVVGSIGKLLRRLIREDIGLGVDLSPGLSRVSADPGQLEQVLLNLAVNARDAMPAGGRLTITTGNVVLGPDECERYPGAAPGRYVRLAVSDTGCGMSLEVQARVFEPFFTTKDVGKGTGLGLATVHGIVAQAGGAIGVESEVGSGTTFTVLLPAVAGAGAGGECSTLRDPRGGETLLLVEDDPAVRQLARLALESQGYTVLEASSGPAAVQAADRYTGTIHLLVSDVVMPAMSGHEVAEALRARRAGLQVLFVSGYTDDEVIRRGVSAARTRSCKSRSPRCRWPERCARCWTHRAPSSVAPDSRPVASRRSPNTSLRPPPGYVTRHLHPPLNSGLLTSGS